jgi:hypothetical protein
VVGCAALALLAGCAASGLVDEWRDAAYREPPLRKVVVLDMRGDQVRRRIWEDAFVRELRDHHVEAVPSYELVPDAPPDTSRIAEMVAEKGFDGVILVHRLPADTRAQHVPGYVTTVPRTRYDRWSGRYATYFREVYHPGYTETERVVRAEISVWLARGEQRMLWAATGQSFDPRDATQASHDMASAVVERLARAHLI